MKGQILSALAALCIPVAGIGLAVGITVHAGATGTAESLRSVASFDSITDPGARSQALFQEVARVLTHPRCMNCHPATRQPTQGDDLHAHIPPMNAGESGFGPDGMACTTCHGPGNRTILGSGLKSIPGADPWLLAPASMAWQGLSVPEICAQVKDPARNGDRSLDDLIHHLAEDHLVGWGWHPGEGRTPVPGTQAQFGELVTAWIATGAECPD